MGTADSTLVIDAETGKAIRELIKLSQAQENLEKGNKKLDASLKGTQGTFDKSIKSIGAFAGTTIASIASLETLRAMLERVRREMDSVVKTADSTAKGMADFAVQVAGQPGAAAQIKSARVMGAGYGLTSAETGVLANKIYATQGATLAKDFPVGARLAQLGVDPLLAADVAQAGIVRGMGSARAASLSLAAADTSQLGVGDMARVIPRTGQFSSLESGLAAASVLKNQGVPVDQLPTAVEGLGRVLNMDKSPLAKAFNLQGMNEAARIAALNRAAAASGDRDAFVRSLGEKYSIGIEEARAIRMTMAGGGMFGEMESKFKGVTGGLLEERYGALLRDDPLFAQRQASLRAASVSEVARIYGPVGEVGQSWRATEQARGARLMREAPGVAPYVVDETGRTGFWGGLAESFISGYGGAGTGAPVTPNRTGTRDIETMRLLEQIEKNTRRGADAVESPGAPLRNANL